MSAQQKPRVRSRYSSLMPSATQENLRRCQARSVSAASTISSRLTVSELLEAKIGEINGELDCVAEYHRSLKDALASKTLTKRKFDEELEALEEGKADLHEELVTINRQRKTLEEDLAVKSGTTRRDDAYAESIMQRVMAVTAKPSKKKFPKKHFRKNVEDYYGAAALMDGVKKVHCPLAGWIESASAKCAYIVPRILSSDELSHLYGVRDLHLLDPRNALLLRRSIEKALDAAKIAIIPIPGRANDNTKWRVILIDQSMSNIQAYQDVMSDRPKGVVKWKHLDGKELVFLNENRPARRYLYFRYIMTYLNHKKQGNDMGRAQELGDQGQMWATPGPYLRRSMVQNLARFVSHEFLPEDLVEENTFTEAPSCPSRGEEAEEILAMSLAVRIRKSEKVAEDKDSDDDDKDDD